MSGPGGAAASSVRPPIRQSGRHIAIPTPAVGPGPRERVTAGTGAEPPMSCGPERHVLVCNGESLTRHRHHLRTGRVGRPVTPDPARD